MNTSVLEPELKRAREGERTGSSSRASQKTKKIWIDLDNSPHVPFFLPIIEGLKKANYQVLLTARDSYQVCELLRLHNLSCRVLGKHYGKRRVMKLAGTALRAAQLLPIALKEKPDLLVSHGSRAQFLVGQALRIPTVMMLDYEFVNATAFLHPDWLFVPEVIPAGHFAQREDHVYRYQGLKEDVYVSRLKPSSEVREQLGINPDELVVTLRPPANEAHYHNPESEEFLKASMEFLLEQPKLRIVLLPRNQNQSAALRSEWSRAIEDKRIVIPDSAVDGLNLIWNSDLVISGGGTMNREAAALGVPVYSIFRGRLGAVDEYLSKTGRLTMLEKVEDVRTKIVLKPRKQGQPDTANRRDALGCILNAVISIAEHKCLPQQS